MEKRTPTPSAETSVGSVIAGRYRLEQQLGEGAVGTVYLAEDLTTRARVAVKLMRAELSADLEALARFDREAMTMKALAHDHIVHALELIRTPTGDACLVMELVDGETLRATLKRLKPLDLPLAVALAGQLSAALSHAHAMGVVHRDLKPENVVVRWSSEGRPHLKVLDFGMARIVGGALGGAVPLTQRGAVFGTPAYMAPEQAMGRAVDARADQYALGVMLFEMLAGRRPFQADNALDMVQLQILATPPGLREAGSSAPDAVAEVIARMLSKRPEERFADVREAVRALTQSALVAAPVPTPEPAAPRGWRRLFAW